MFDVVGATLLLLPALPFMAAAALTIWWTSGSPVLFRQARCGKDGRTVTLLKFRTMAPNDSGPGVTRQGDTRVTPAGRLLRKWKLDELPQLFNVLRGDLSFVGPRPDLPQYWQQLGLEFRRALTLKPGLTSPATLQFRYEEELLADVPVEELEHYYVTELFPEKLATDLRYAQQATFYSDMRLLCHTAAAIVRPHRFLRASTAPPIVHQRNKHA